MIQSNIIKRKDTWCEGQKTPGTNFQEPTVEPHRMHLIPPAMSCDDTGEMLFMRKLVGDPVPRIFIGAHHSGETRE